MNAHFQRSTGQGRIHSKTSTTISSNNPIVSRLFSRSITGRNLNIKIHQHFGKTIHLVWKPLDKSPNNPSERCMERYFSLYEEIENFCWELKYGTLEGLCDCVFPGLYKLLDTKVTICFRRPLLQIERYSEVLVKMLSGTPQPVSMQMPCNIKSRARMEKEMFINMYSCRYHVIGHKLIRGCWSVGTYLLDATGL